MNPALRTHVNNIFSTDKDLQNAAYTALLEATERPVEWAYEIWDTIVAGLSHKDNRARAITSQILCNLAKSDPEKRLHRDFGTLFNVTRDSRFVTARHCMQSLWKIGLVGEEERRMLVDALEQRFRECETEKNCTLIRYDILEGLHSLYLNLQDEELRTTAVGWIEMEEDSEYRKKYLRLWKKD